MNIDAPASGASVRQPFLVAGWAIDATSTRTNGVDVVHVYAYPNSGGAPIFLGVASVNVPRPDVAGAFGPQFGTSGYGLVARGLPPGGYLLAIFPHSTIANAFGVAHAVNVTVQPSAAVVIDAPANNAIVGSSFVVAGWAADFAAASGGGIDIVHVYAYPLDRAGVPIFLGAGNVSFARPDVAAYAGAAQFGKTGYSVPAALAPGVYQVVAYGRSLVTGTFAAAATTNITVR